MKKEVDKVLRPANSLAEFSEVVAPYVPTRPWQLRAVDEATGCDA